MNFKKNFSLAALALLLAACECTDVCKKVDSQEAATPGTAGDFAQNIKNKVYFEFDSAKIPAEAHAAVEAQSGWLKTYPSTTATVAGHCDIRGTTEYNLALGAKRAAAVESSLVKNGVDKTRLSTISYGKDKLLVEGNTEEAHAQNRVAITTVN